MSEKSSFIFTLKAERPQKACVFFQESMRSIKCIMWNSKAPSIYPDSTQIYAATAIKLQMSYQPNCHEGETLLKADPHFT